MSKKTKSQNAATESTEVTETRNTGREPQVEGDNRTKYGFDHGKRCPACQSTDTEAKTTQGQIQYRHCRRVGCRHYHKNYVVIGKKI